MSNRKLCGFDLNGWRDFAARNWRSVPGDDDEIGGAHVIAAGPLTSVVQITEGAQWVGGPQADLAPHGMGEGWGAVGMAKRRVSVRSLLDGQGEAKAQIAAAFAGIARGAAQNIVAIDDRPATTELTQERLLDALSAAKFRNPMLVWRPVLAALYALDLGLVPGEAKIAVLCQSPLGVTVQKLQMRRAAGSSREVIAPERRQAAQEIPGEIGYEALVHRAREVALGPAGMSARTAHRAQARAVGRHALGMDCAPEMLRAKNGDWDVLDMGQGAVLASAPLSQALPDLDDCAVVLVETLSHGEIRQALVDCVEGAVSGTVIALDSDAVAKGALCAAQRVDRGDPVYFDFLPRISTIVSGLQGAANYDLIEADETLPAGRVYRSPAPARLAIPAGQHELSVYLRKQGAAHPRKAKIHIETPLSEASAALLVVEQTPAAGRARIMIEAQGLGRSFVIDWEDAKEDDRSWDDIIASQETPVTFPQRLVLDCGMGPWKDRARSIGLLQALKAHQDPADADWEILAQCMGARPGAYCISSDGALPPEITPSDRALLDRATTEAMTLTRARRGSAGSAQTSNAALKFLTWQFRYCPPEVADWLIDCIEGRGLPMFSSPLILTNSSWVLIYQGLGRIVGDAGREAKAIRLLLSSDIAAWQWRVETACMAFLLSRSDTAPLVLTRADVDRLAQRTLTEFKDNLRSEYTKFNYAPFLLAGLLRWRLKEPRALLPGADPVADDLLLAIETTEQDLISRSNPDAPLIKKRNKYLSILKDLKSELRGEGGNPNLLLDIYNV